MTGVQTCALPIYGPQLRAENFDAQGRADAGGKHVRPVLDGHRPAEIGRASCRERV